MTAAGKMPIAESNVRPHLPTLREVACQAYRDWFGKDVQETPTVSYVWTADQFGHFGLGFQITYALTWIAALLDVNSFGARIGLALVNLAGWIVKEVSDFFREKRLADVAASVFPFNANELWWNIVTALFYIGAGIVVAGASFVGPRQALEACCLLLVPALGLGVWWLRRKITFQQAGLPYLYRLANFPPNLADPAAVEALIDPSTMPERRHLVLSGPIGAGKTCLAVGIGTEFAFRMGIGRYTTLVKLLQSNLKNPHGEAQEFQDGRTLWPWQSSDLLVVDDVDDAGDMATTLTYPCVLTEPPIAQMKLALSQLLDQGVKAGLAARRTVWVIGKDDPAAWIAMLQEVFGIADGAIAAVILSETIEQVLARKPAGRGLRSRSVPA